MRRIIATGLAALLLNGCTLTPATPRPGEELAVHQECDRFARAATPGFWEQWRGPKVSDSAARQGAGGWGALPPFPPLILLVAAVVIVVLPPVLVTHGVKTGRERQEQYDMAYDICLKNPLPLGDPGHGDAPPENAPEPPPDEAPPARIFSG